MPEFPEFVQGTPGAGTHASDSWGGSILDQYTACLSRANRGKSPWLGWAGLRGLLWWVTWHRASTPCSLMIPNPLHLPCFSGGFALLAVKLTWTRLLQEEGSQYKSPQSCPREGMVKGAQLSCIYNSKNCPCRRPKKCLSSLCDSPCGKQACTSWIFRLKWLSSLCVPSFLPPRRLFSPPRWQALRTWITAAFMSDIGELWFGVRRQRLVQTGNTGPPLENPQTPFLFLWEGQVLGTMQHLGFRLKICYQCEFCTFLSHVTCKVHFCYAIRE